MPPAAKDLEQRLRVTGRRILQYILDLLGGCAVVSGRAARQPHRFDQAFPAQLTRLSRLTAAPGWPTVVAVVLSATVWFAVFVVVPIWVGRTPAMVLLRLSIAQVDGTSPTRRQHVARALLLVIEGGVVGWLVIVLSRRRQRIGDHLASTLVVGRAPTRTNSRGAQ